MDVSQCFALAAAGGTESAPPQSQLLLDGHATGVIVPGVILEAQYTSRDWHLLFTTENIPYEEALHILLLDRRLIRLDHAELSHPFAAGALTDLQPLADEAEVRFSFYGGDIWRLGVLSAPRLLTPREAPKGVHERWRRLLKVRYLVLQRLQ